MNDTKEKLQKALDALPLYRADLALRVIEKLSVADESKFFAKDLESFLLVCQAQERARTHLEDQGKPPIERMLDRFDQIAGLPGLTLPNMGFKILVHDEQKIGDGVTGYTVLEAVKLENNCDTTIMDFFLLHQGFIPSEWEGKEVFFWKNIFLQGTKKRKVVCYMYFNTKEQTWCQGVRGLDDLWTPRSVALVFA